MGKITIRILEGMNKENRTWDNLDNDMKGKPEVVNQIYIHIYPTPPLGQDITQGQFLSGV